MRGQARIPWVAWQLAVAMFAATSSGNILTPLLPQLQQEFGIPLTTAGLVVAVFGLTRLMVDLPSGFLADRVGRVRLAVIAIVALAISSVVGAWSPNIEVLIAARAVAGFGVAIIAMVVLSAMSDAADAADRGRVMSLMHLANNTGIGLFPVIGALVGVAFGWRATFIVTGVTTAVCALTLLPSLRALDRSSRVMTVTRRSAAPAVAGTRRVGALAVLYAGVVANHIHRHGFRNTLVPLYGALVIGLDAQPIALAVAGMAFAGLLVAMPGGVASDRYGRRRVIVIGLTCLALADLTFLGTVDATTFVLAALVVGAVDFFASSQSAAVAELTTPAERSRALGGFRFSVDLGALIGPILLAWSLEHLGAPGAIWVTTLVLLTAAMANRIGLPRLAGHTRAAVTPPDGGSGAAQARP
ncbi:MAG: MFS transporter [Chloroflexi bacterium]|nr:MFS transporter [Chloroflexota bacterium]